MVRVHLLVTLVSRQGKEKGAAGGKVVAEKMGGRSSARV